MSTTPSRCRQRASVSTTRPRTRTRADNARPHPRGAPAPGPGTLRTRLTTPAAPGGAPSLRPGALWTRSTWTRSTTPTARRNTRTRARPQEDCSRSRTTPSEYAHKDPDSRNTHRTQGRNQALVCGPVLPNPLPCVRHQRTRTPKKDGAKEQTHQPVKQTSKPANPRRKGRLTAWGPARTTWEVAPAPPGEPRRLCPGPAPAPLRRNPLGPSSGCGRCRTTWGAAPAAPPYGSGFTARCRATMPPVRLRYWTSDQPLRAIMAPRARWSGHWRIDSTK